MSQANSINTTGTPGATGIPVEAFKTIWRLRNEAREEIDRLIRFLDDTDNHMEREPDDPEEDGGDTEPSLGSFDRMADQSKAWRQQAGELCYSVDAEQDDADSEPSLGSVGDHHVNQEGWAAGSRRDLEKDDAESGIGDHDGLLEQVGSQDWQHGGQG
jgi:hypothetical protein